MIINIGPITFGDYPIRNGDMVAIINVLQFLRKKHNDPSIKFYIPSEIIIRETEYHEKFYQYLLKTTDFFSDVPGEPDVKMPYDHIMLWDFRDNIGDVVSIPNDMPMEKKVCVFPLFDAFYNTLRNWPPHIFYNIMNHVAVNYPEHEKLVCAKELPEGIEIHPEFKLSTDFITNIEHIRTCQTFVGGDTGTTHYASALDRGPLELVYFYTCRGMMHSMPFHLFNGKGNMNTYSTQYKLDLF